MTIKVFTVVLDKEYLCRVFKNKKGEKFIEVNCDNNIIGLFAEEFFDKVFTFSSDFFEDIVKFTLEFPNETLDALKSSHYRAYSSF